MIQLPDVLSSFAPPLALSRRRLLMTGAAAGAGALAGLHADPAKAVLQIDITQGNVQPIPIAICDFISGTANEGEVPRSMSAVIANNLKRSGLFIPIDQSAFLEKLTDPNATPRFADWRTINAQALVVGRIADRVVPVNGSPGIRPMLTLTLSSDHRVVDGAQAAGFLADLAGSLATP